MKNLIKASLVGVVILFAHAISAQTNLNFKSVVATEEGAIRLSWNSKTNEVYQIEYADELVDINNGGTTWLPLYTDYPSHGTNTFVADAGNYDLSPEILHPKLLPMRFYRVFLVQTNDSPSNPTISIATPTNGASLSGDVTVIVSATSSEILSEVELYIDGQKQWTTINGTNFTINTCEWPNGTHTFFAVAKSQSGFEGVPNGAPVTYGRSVSAYRTVTFNNLITRLDFSEPFFEPALGQTQKVTATFAANVNWTLRIQNAMSNDVRYVTGSGTTMQFNWDGTGTNGAAIPDGVYSYLLTAQTNGGQSLMSMSASPALSFVSTAVDIASKSEAGTWCPTTAKEAMTAGLTSYFIKTPPIPKIRAKIKHGTKTVFSTEVVDETPQLIEVQIPVKMQEKFLQSLGAPTQSAFLVGGGESGVANYAGPSTETTRAPKRKPKVGVKGEVGTFGICYKSYGTNGIVTQHPLTGWPFPLQTRVAIDGQSPTSSSVLGRINLFKNMADGFSQVMKQGGWKAQFVKADDNWNATDIKKPGLGGYSIFNNCNFGILMTHGSYANNTGQGNSSDGVKHTYCWLGANDYVKLADMNFGSDGTNGLRWMSVLACNVMRPANYTSMDNHGVVPVNDNLHLLMGWSTIGYTAQNLGKYYADNMVRSNQPVIDALVNAAAKAYGENSSGITGVVKIGISGWHSCLGDSLQLYSDPDLNGLEYIERLVFTPP